MMNILQFANFIWWAELKVLEHGARLVITESLPGDWLQGPGTAHLSWINDKVLDSAPLLHTCPASRNASQGIPEQIHVFFFFLLFANHSFLGRAKAA